MAATVNYYPAVGGGFGSDTIVQLPNASTTLVDALEMVTTLSTATAGSEVSQLAIKLLSAGAQVTAMTIKPLATEFPVGTSGLPGITFAGHATTGLWWDNSNAAMAVSVSGTYAGLFNSNRLWMLDGAASLILGVSNGVTMARNTSGGMQLTSSIHNVTIGGDGALATNAATGFLEIPSCAGTPTGTVVPRSGKVALVYDSTNFKLGVSAGGGTWKQTAALT